jgi:hypothetical protein
MISLTDIVTEITDKKIKKILKHIFGVPKEMPKYVFKDFVMSPNGFFPTELKQMFIDEPDLETDDIKDVLEDWIKIKWEKQVLELSASDFTKENQKTMIQRKFGNANPNKVPDDEKRTEYQRKMAKKLKPGANEPVIMLNKGNEYRLLEGWHRTMAILSLGSNGETDPRNWNKIKIKAWVGTGSSIKNVW